MSSQVVPIHLDKGYNFSKIFRTSKAREKKTEKKPTQTIYAQIKQVEIK
jgi:hypothetical protein